LNVAREALSALFGAKTEQARLGALLLAEVAVTYLGPLATVVDDEDEEG
jgi:hypothetical protein